MTRHPYTGCIEVSFRLDGDHHRVSDLQVHVLASSDRAVASEPIIGYIVTEAVINRNEGKTKGERKQLAHKVSKTFAIAVNTAQDVVTLMQDSGSDPETEVACTGGKRVPLLANRVTTVDIQAHVGSQARGQNMFRQKCSTPNRRREFQLSTSAYPTEKSTIHTSPNNKDH